MRGTKFIVLTTMLLLISVNSYSQHKISLPDKFQNKQIEVVNRVISLYGEQNDALEMNSKNGDGMGILQDVEFEKGAIDIELLGENNPGKSFIGIAFNIQNDSTYEAIYFRPFNFIAKEQIRKDHMVQYIYHPENTWRKLRTERTGEFEDEIATPPNPDDWFNAKIMITDEKVEVYVDESPNPVLIVGRLTSPKSNRIGIWTGHGSSGRFRNLNLKGD